MGTTDSGTALAEPVLATSTIDALTTSGDLEEEPCGLGSELTCSVGDAGAHATTAESPRMERRWSMSIPISNPESQPKCYVSADVSADMSLDTTTAAERRSWLLAVASQ